ncbi:hypothetical protein V8F20_001670 [Naviculisporaceae sp. PSN 640]
MKFAQVLLAAFSASLSMADFDCPATSSLPQCGIGCLIEAAIDVGCGVEDIACQCSSTSQLEAAAATCIVQSCTNEGEIEGVTSAAQAICQECNTAAAAPTITDDPMIPWRR